MKTKTFAKGRKVVVAVNFDANATSLVKAAASLCRASGMELRLVHVTEPFFANYIRTVEPIAGIRPDLILGVENEAIKSAEAHLKELVTDLAKDIPVTSTVVVGRISEGIIADAVAADADLIITGAAKHSHRFIPKGFSTPLSLMADSPLPVLVVPEDANLDFMKEGFRVLLADDLRDETMGAVRAAFDIAAHAHVAEVLQLHVNVMSEETFAMCLDSALRAAHSPSELSSKELYSLAEKFLGDKIESRGAEQKRDHRAAGGRWNAMVAVGRVDDELSRGAQKFSPDLMVFGRHQRFHGKSMAFGQVPFFSMLAVGKPVLVVPHGA